MIKGGMLATRVSYVGVVVDALVYVCKLLPMVSGYVQRYEAARAWLRSRRAVGDFSLQVRALRARQERTNLEARAWLGSRRRER